MECSVKNEDNDYRGRSRGRRGNPDQMQSIKSRYGKIDQPVETGQCKIQG